MDYDSSNLFLGVSRFKFINILVVNGVLGLLIPYEYLRKYSSFHHEANDKFKLVDSLKLKMEWSIVNFARYNSFDVNWFFRRLFLNYLPGYILVIAANIGACIYELSPATLIGLAMAFVCPVIVFAIERKNFLHDMTCEDDYVKSVFLGLLHSLVNLLEMLIIVVMTVIVMFFTHIILTTYIIGADYKGEENVLIISRSWMIVVFVAVLFVIYALIKKENRRIIGKLKERFIAIMIASFLLLGGFFLSLNYYTCVTEDKIVVKTFGKKYEYTLDSVKDFKIVDDDSRIKMELTFSDGYETDLLGKGIYSSSENWDKTYHEDVGLCLMITEKLQARGIMGEFSKADRVSLKKVYDEGNYEKRLKDDLDKLILIYDKMD